MPRDEQLANTVLREPNGNDHAGIRTKTLHVIGRTDVVVVPERSEALVAVSSNARTEYHMGGS